MGMLSVLSTTHWHAFGPAPITGPVGLGTDAGRIEAVAPHPTDVTVMYAAGNNSGVWKTGVWEFDPPTWIGFGLDQRSLSVAGFHPVAVHRKHPAQVFYTVSGAGAGVLKSTNDGISWTLLANSFFEGATIGSIALHPETTSTMFVSVWGGGPGGGVYKSTDGGLTWANVTSSLGDATDVIVSRYDPDTLFAGIVGSATTSGVYRSTNAGATWSIASPFSGFFVGDAIRLESGSAHGVVYVTMFENSLESSQPTVQRYRSADGGSTWHPLAATPGDPELRSWHVLLGVDPKDDKHVFANDAYALFESKDAGATWKAAEKIGDDWVNIAFDAGGQAVVTADRGIYRYNPKKGSWKVKDGNLHVTQFYTLTPDPTDLDVMYGVAQDHPFAMKFSGTDEWVYTTSGGGETGRVLVDPTKPKRVYVSNPLSAGALVQRSVDGGQTLKTIRSTTEFADGDYALAYSTQRSFAMDPTNPARLLLGTTRVWETTNATAASPTWNHFANLPAPSGPAGSYITALAIAPSNPQTVYAATQDGHVWVTTNGGSTWTKRENGIWGSGRGNVLDIRVCPTDPKRAVAVTSGTGGVWLLETVGGSLTWTNVGSTLPSYLSCLTVFADWAYATPPIYVGTTRGVQHSVDHGAHWSPFGVAMPATTVGDLQPAPHNALVAGTFGYGGLAILAQPSTLSGRVVATGAEAGRVRPLPGITVYLDTGDASPSAARIRAITDARGGFRLGPVPPGTYTLRQLPPAGFTQVRGPAPGITVNGSTVGGLEFVNQPSRPGDAAAVAASDLATLAGRRPHQPIGARLAKRG